MQLKVQCNIRNWGKFSALFNEDAQLQRIILPGNNEVNIEDYPLERKFAPAWKECAERDFRKFLCRFFDGEPFPELQADIDLKMYTDFERKVLLTLRTVLPGQRVTYARLAFMAGFDKAWRAVGSVMRKNLFPLYFPCHRVVCSSGNIGHYSGGQGFKGRLLKHEKIQQRMKTKESIC